MAKSSLYSHAIQLTDADFDEVDLPFIAPCSLRLSFDDVEDMPEHFSDPLDDLGPTLADVRAIVDFAKQLPSDARLVIHCEAGISRSTAAAMIVLSVRGVSPDGIQKILREVAPQADPNLRMLRMAGLTIG